jgi:O-antigen ligase/polysaccharide polymerase Wzy-like membrane protein
MRRGAVTALTAVLLAGPAVLAFHSGGFFPPARLAAGIGAWAVLGLAVLVVPGPVAPRTWPVRAALVGLAGLAAWTALSASWAPSAGPARQTLELALLYLPALAAAALLLRGRAAARAAEPALAAGALVVIGYGLAGRLLPGVVHLAASARAGGRLEQPLTYWNATGALAAVGLVLVARIAGDRTRSSLLRTAAAAAAAPLGLGVYLSFSRGAVAAGAVGLVVLAILVPSRDQARAAGAALLTAALSAAAVAPFAGVRALDGTLGTREREGLVCGALLLGIMALAASTHARAARRMGGGARLPRRLRTALVGVAVAGALVPYAAALAERSAPASASSAGASAARLTRVGSNRARYWAVALREVGQHPVEGIGAGGFGVAWLRERTIDERVQDAHSLAIETAAELGLVGLALLALFAGGVVAAARRAVISDRVVAAGPAAAALVWALHAGVDWDWEMPALTGVAILLAGLLLGRCERAATAQRGGELADELALEGGARAGDDHGEQRDLGERSGSGVA